jgi:hypothetical protein
MMHGPYYCIYVHFLQQMLVVTAFQHCCVFIDKRDILPGQDAALLDVSPYEPAERPATVSRQVSIGWKETSDC